MPSHAAVGLSLPLEGYYRPGKYMPVRITAELSDAATALIIQGPGAIPTRVQTSQGRVDATIPLLPLHNTLRALHWSANDAVSGSIDTPLHPLQHDQRLVGLVTDDLPFARQLFPGESVITVRLDPATPLPGPAAAWQMLDALVLDLAIAQELGQSKLATLLAGGTTLAILGPSPLNPHWPWQRQDSYWILRPELAGPRLAGVYSRAFAPVQGWQAEWPAAFRRRIVLYFLLFSILTLGLTLFHFRWMPLLILLLSAATVLLLGLWWSHRAAVLTRSGEIIVHRGSAAQADVWHYYASPTAAAATVPWLDLTWPFIEDWAYREAITLTLNCQSDGQPLSFTAGLPRSLKLAFLTRSLGQPVPVEPVPASESSPLVRLARRAYLVPGDRILGQIPPPDDARNSLGTERWPTLIIQRTPQP